MSTEVLAVVIVLLTYVAGYVVSRYALAIHIDPDEFTERKVDVSHRQHRFLKRLADDPLLLTQVAVVFKSFSAILIATASIPVWHLVAVRLQMNPWILSTIALAVQWLLLVVVVEYLPRRTSRNGIHGRPMRGLWLATTVFYVFLPVVKAYRAGLARSGHRQEVTEEEKEDLIERAIETLADEAGIGERIVEDEEKEMIGQIFLLDQTTVREIMIPRIHITAIDEAMSFQQIRRLVARDGHSRYPVFRETVDQIIGMIYVKDLFNRMPAPGEPFTIGRYLREPYFVPESKVIGELLREFRTRRLHIALVVDEYGGVAGLVTLEDIIEEIVGDIQDEHDWEQDQWLQLPNGWYQVSAGLLVEEMQENLETEYECDDNDTVGGLIYDLVGSVPKEGQTIHWHDIEFEVEKVEGQRIVSVKAKRFPRQEST